MVDFEHDHSILSILFKNRLLLPSALSCWSCLAATVGAVTGQRLQQNVAAYVAIRHKVPEATLLTLSFEAFCAPTS